MRDAFARILREHRLLAPGERVLVALSGGADSVALLHLLHSLAADFPLTVHAAHLDHAMRPESAQDASFVRRLCAGLGVPLSVTRVDIPALAQQRRLGLEEAAREARREFLGAAAERAGCARIALGHHRGDQAETVLHRLLRGSATPGLAGMRLESGPFIRPLLPFTRQQLREYLSTHGLPHVEDVSNGDPAYTRNRIRLALLPLLAQFNPRIEEHLARLGGRLAVEEEYWEEQERLALAGLARFGDGEARLDRAGLLALHPALRLRVLRRALREVRGDLRSLSAAHFEAVDRLSQSARPQGEIHLPGAWAGRRYTELWLRRLAPQPPAPFSFTVTGPGAYPLPDGGELRVTLTAPQGEERWAAEFAVGRTPFPLTVRSPQPGDRFRPSGMAGSRKLKDFLIDFKVEREARERLVLVEADEILWLVGMRRCEGRRPAGPEGPVLRLAAIGLERSSTG